MRVPCPGAPGSVAGHDSHTGKESSNPSASGGSGGGGAAPPGGIYTVPNMYGYDTKLKSFESGVLDAALRKYYKSDVNIKNSVNTFLKENRFSELSQTEAKAALNFGKTLDLNFQQFNWAFINKQSQKMQDTEEYLITVIMDDQTKGFVKAAIDAWMEDGEVDFKNEILKDSTFISTKADCVLNALISTYNNLFKKTSQAFTGGRSKFKIKFTTYNKATDIADARTPLPDSNGILEIRINMPNTANSNAIDLARMILHETIHAELHRIKLTNNAGPNPLPQAQYNWYIEMWDFYEGYYNNLNKTATAAEHNYMALYQINNIAQVLCQFDENTHPL